MIFTNHILGCWHFDVFENCENPYPLPAPSPACLSGLTLMGRLHRDTPAHRYTVFLNAMCDALSMLWVQDLAQDRKHEKILV